MHFDYTQQTVTVLRHSHRPTLDQNFFGNDLELTLKGKRAARILGRSFAQIPLGEVYTSPILRCVQTTEEFLKGAGQTSSIFMSKLLGDPGLFVADAKLAGPVFLENTIEKIALAIVNGQTLPGMRPLAEGGKLFLENILQIKCFPCLMITHDIVICLLCCFFFQSKDVQKYLPGFLEGFSMKIGPEQVSIYHRKETRYLSLI
jgi:hypothetical protein